MSLFLQGSLITPVASGSPLLFTAIPHYSYWVVADSSLQQCQEDVRIGGFITLNGAVVTGLTYRIWGRLKYTSINGTPDPTIVEVIPGGVISDLEISLGWNFILPTDRMSGRFYESIALEFSVLTGDPSSITHYAELLV